MYSTFKIELKKQKKKQKPTGIVFVLTRQTFENTFFPEIQCVKELAIFANCHLIFNSDF